VVQDKNGQNLPILAVFVGLFLSFSSVLDVHADRAGIDTSRRRENTTKRGTAASVRVRIEHEIGHAPRTVSIERLLKHVASKPARIEFVPMTVMGLPLQ